MSENPNEIFGNGVLVNGTDITWFRVWEPGTYPYALTDGETFGDGTAT